MKNKKRISKVITEALDTDATYASSANAIIEHLKKMYEAGTNNKLDAFKSADACGYALNRALKTLHKGIDSIGYAFPDSLTDEQVQISMNSAHSAAIIFGSTNMRMLYADRIKEMSLQRANKSDLEKICSILYTSKALEFIARNLHSYSKQGSPSKVYVRVEELKKDLIESNTSVRKTLKLLEFCGYLGNVSQYYNIDPDKKNSIQEILMKAFEVRENGLSKEQMDQMSIEAERISGIKGITDRLSLKGNYCEANFISFLKIFSNRYYEDYKRFLEQKSGTNAIPHKEFLDNWHKMKINEKLSKEDRTKAIKEKLSRFQGITVHCTIEELNKLNAIDRDLVHSRLNVTEFLTLEYYTQLSTLQRWMKSDTEVRSILLTEAENEVRNRKLGAKIGKTKTKTVSTPAPAPVVIKKRYDF